MDEEYRKLFNKAGAREPRRELGGNILHAVYLRQGQIARSQLVMSAFASVGSLAMGIVALVYAGQEFSESSFAQYASLLYSDGSVVVAYWREFLLSLVESVPLFGISAFLSAVLLFLVSCSVVFRNSIFIRHQSFA